MYIYMLVARKNDELKMPDKLQIVNRLLKAVNETLEFFDHEPITHLYEFHKVCVCVCVCVCVYAYS